MVLCFECGKVGGDVGEEFVPDTVVVPLQFTLVLLLITGDQRFVLVEGITTSVKHKINSNVHLNQII